LRYGIFPLFAGLSGLFVLNRLKWIFNILTLQQEFLIKYPTKIASNTLNT
jgi:hypothetical protein